MGQIWDWLARAVSSWKFWIVIPPWDVGVRVRLGKVAASLQPGVHFRIPMLDEIVLVNTRLRLQGTPTITVQGSTPTKARVVSAQVGFAVVDPVKAMLRYADPGTAVVALAQAKIASGGRASDVAAQLNAELRDSGLAVEYVYFIEDVEVRTYRLLQGGSGGVYSGCSVAPSPGFGGASSGLSSY